MSEESESITCPTCNVVTELFEDGVDGAYCVDCWEKQECDICNYERGNCECVACGSCEEKTDIADLYEGRCPSCEDAQMVRSIR